MGLFEKFFKKPEIISFTYKPLSDYEAWIGILYACITADGDVENSEIHSLSRMLLLKNKFSGIDIVPLYKNVAEAKQKIGNIGLIDACSLIIKEEDKPTLFSMAVDIVLADGVLEEEEMKVVEYIAASLAIDTNLVEKIVEVMLIRNNGNLILD
jgi:uncharacterized tellurite resistance protein B-like protein